jgi:hypothetical protein
MSKTMTCLRCGKQFVTYPSHISKGRKFCSQSCYHIHRTESQPEHFWDMVDKSSPDGCWTWTGFLTPQGYGRFCVAGDNHPAHAYAYELTYGPIPPGLEALHKCDNPPCVRPDHIFIGTQGDNVRDCATKGRIASGDRNGLRVHPEAALCGERNGHAKLTEPQVIAIRSAYVQGGVTLHTLAEQYRCTLSNICCIVNRRTWKHVP